MNYLGVTSNPWAGLSSYQDPETADVQLKFCGRDNESFDVAQLIDDNIFVTLYGKSGMGKTSLLNAGVFPRLRQEQYLPVSIRLGMDALGISFQQCILAKLGQALQGRGAKTTVEVVPMPADERSTEYLWSFFACTRFTTNDGQTLFPVLVFDQFEEVFRNRRADAETLLRQIHFMMDENHALSDRMVDGRPYQYDFNFRFVVSIREDDLYRLEDSIDNCYLPDMKHCRYRLRSLSEQGARDAILIPGEGLFRSEEQEGIVNTIINIARNKEDQSISTNLLSLVCSRIFVDYQKSGADHITPALVDSFIKGNPFERFYNEATRGFSNREKNYIEDHLVDSTGRRNSIPESDFLLHVPKGKQLLEGDTRILQRISTSSDGGNYRIELIHDSFCEPLSVQKGKRKQRKRIRLLLFAVVAIAFAIGIIWLYMGQMMRASEKMQENEILNTVQKSKLYLNHGDSYRACVTLLGILPKSSDDPCTSVVEEAFRSATAHNNAVLTGHTAAVNSVCYSEDGKYLLSGSYDQTIKLWNVYDGICLKTFERHKDFVYKVAFCPDGKTIISHSREGTIKVWNIKTGKVQKEYEDCYDFIYSPSKKYICIFFNSGPQIMDSRSYQCVKKFDDYKQWEEIDWMPDEQWLLVYMSNHDLCKVNVQTGKLSFIAHENEDVSLIHMTVNPKGHKIAAAFGYDSDEPGFVRVWDTLTGKLLHTLRSNERWTNGVAFSPDGKTLASTSMGGQVLLWDVENGACLDILKGHSFGSSSPCFNFDGSFLATSSADNTIRIWDIRPQEVMVLENNISSTFSISFNKKGDRVILLTRDSIFEYDIYSKSKLNTLPSCLTNLNIAYSDEGEILAISCKKDSIYIWDYAEKKWQRKLKGENVLVRNLALKRGYNEIACFTTDSTMQIWNMNEEKLIKNIGKQPYDCWGMNYSKDGTLLVQECSDSTIRIWNTKMWDCIQLIKTENGARHIAPLTSDNKYLITCKHKTAFLWNIKTGECVRQFEGHTSRIYGLAVSNDGRYLATTSHDAYVKVWDLATGVCLQSTLSDQYTAIAFSPQGDKLCAASDNVSLIDFPPLQQLIDETRERFKNRQLTHEERRKYYLE